MAEYYTYKKQVPLKSGEMLGFTPGRGYYAIAAPVKASGPAKSASTDELGGLSVLQAEQVASSYGLTTSTSGDEGPGTSSTTSSSTPPTKHATQPSKAPTIAAKTPTAAEVAAKSMITDAYRPVVFKTSTKAKPNAALVEAAYRQRGTVASPVAVAKTTKPATANAKKNDAKSVKPATTTTSKKTAVKSTASAAKHPASAAALSTFYAYKKDVHLKPGQTLAYTAGKGYYVRDSAALQKGSTVTKASAPTGVSDGQHELTTAPPKGVKRTLASAIPPPATPAHTGTKPTAKKHAPNSRGSKVKATASGTSVSHRGPTFRFGDTTVTTSLHAGASLSWSGGKGKGKVTVSLDPETKAISVKQGPLSFTDNGQLSKAAKSYEPSPLQAALGIVTSSTGPHPITPYQVDVGIGSQSVEADFGKVHVSVQTQLGPLGQTTVNAEISTPITVPTKGYGTVTGEYSISVEMNITRAPTKKPGLPFDVVVAWALALALASQRGGVFRGEPGLVGISG